MKPVKLIHFDNTPKDLLFWIKRYLAFKISTLSTKNTTDDFDMAALVRDMLKDSTDNIDAVMEIAKLAKKQGIGSLGKTIGSIEKFYRFIEKNADKFPSITDIYIGTIKHFANVEYVNESESMKNDLFGTARNFFNFIDDNTIKGEHLFKITKGEKGENLKRVHQKPKKSLPVSLTEDEMRAYNAALPKMENPDPLEYNRDILIGRLLFFAGITAGELTTLKNEDFTQDEIDNNVLWLNVRGKGAAKRSIPMPKRKIIAYLNAYKLLCHEKKNDLFFFHPSDPKKEIPNALIRKVLEKQFKFAGVDIKKATPSIIRNTFGIYLYRRMMMDGNVNAARYVKEVMGHSNIRTTTALVRGENPRLLTAADAFAEFIEK